MDTTPLRLVLGRWLLAQVNWRNTVRLSGLFGMMYLVFFKTSPDPTALIAMGTMIGLPTFFWLDPYQPEDRPPRGPRR